VPENEEIQGLEFHETPTGAVFSWSNRQIEINRLLMAGYLSGWLLTFPLAVFLTASLIRDLFRWGQGLPTGPTALAVSAVVLVLSWGIAWYLSYTILRWTWQESLQVDDMGVSISFTGLLAPRDTSIFRDDIWRISFERIRTRREQEASYTLNVFHGNSRETLAIWMSKSEKKKLFDLLRKTIELQGWTYIEFREGKEGRLEPGRS
jgi:hypothetical protein